MCLPEMMPAVTLPSPMETPRTPRRLLFSLGEMLRSSLKSGMRSRAIIPTM